MPREHHLKTWPAPFAAVDYGIKQFEFRRNDRDFERGDVLVLQEYDPAELRYTGREIQRLVTYVAHGVAFGIPAGFCCMSIAEVPRG